MINTELIPSEVAELLRYVIPQNVELAKEGHLPIAYNIEGLPGISKTSVVKQVCNEFDTHYYIRLNVSEIEQGDLVGMPLTQYKMCKGEECLWVSDKLLNNYILQGYSATGESRMSYSKPEWLIGKEDKPCVLVLDDYNRGMSLLMNSCMRITDEQQYISWSLPKGSTVILTCNPDGGEDSFNVSSLDDAQATRFLTIKMKPSVQDWARDYAEGKINDSLINFMLKHPEIIETTGTNENGEEVKRGNLRIWTKFFLSIEGLCNNLSDNWGKIFNIGQNSLPVEHLLMLNKFIEDKLDQIPTPEKLLKSNTEDALKALKSVIGEGNKKRVDISSILSRRILNYTLVNHKSFDKNMINSYSEILKSSYLSPDLVLLSLKKTTKLFPELLKDKKLIEILTT